MARPRALIACEFSGTLRRALNARGWDATSVDLVPATDDGVGHIVGDVRPYLTPDYLLCIAHPPCQFLSSSGLHWNGRTPGRSDKTEAALDFVARLMMAPIEHIAIENPVGCIGTRLRPADCILQPYEFGDDASKRTALWLKNLPIPKPTKYVEPEYGCKCGHRFAYLLGKYGCPNCAGDNGPARPVWANQTASGQNRLGPSADRAAIRAITYQGIADALADQFTQHIFGAGALVAQAGR